MLITDRNHLTARTVVMLFCMSLPQRDCAAESPRQLRVATYNLQDVRSAELTSGANERLAKAAAAIQEIRPDVILLTEIAYDDAVPEPDNNGQRFAAHYLTAVPPGSSVATIDFDSFMAPCNTGIPSGFDLDNDGQSKAAAGSRAYGNDCWGFGTFPGQYAMALLVRKGLVIDRDNVRTFRNLRWNSMPGALAPRDPQTGAAWYSVEEWQAFPLSSKSHWDVPVKLESGKTIHFLCSHPTPPVFDGAEDRNGSRNHDEIRFWAEYLSGADWIVDDQGRRGSFSPESLFVILGDLNADPDEGDARNNPVGRLLLTHPRVQGDFVPQVKESGGEGSTRLDADDTATWGLRVDYVLPSRNLHILDGGVVRTLADGESTVSDHFPVWIDLEEPKP